MATRVDGAEYVTTVDGAESELWNYDPKPVFDATSFWVMIWDNAFAPENWAQVGWALRGDWDSDSSEGSKVFLQVIQDGADDETWYYDLDDDEWFEAQSGYDRAVSPTSPKNYRVYRSGGTIYINYDGGSYKSFSSESWDADNLRVAAETWNFGFGTPKKGDHAPGHDDGVTQNPNRIQANSTHYLDGISWYDTSLDDIDSAAIDNIDVDLDNNTADGVRVWDPRCGS